MRDFFIADDINRMISSIREKVLGFRYTDYKH